MTFTLELEKEHIYFAVTLIVLLIQLYNTWRIGKLKSEVNALWSQISIMAMAAGTALDKIEKKIDEKRDK
jgi:hypothetical protein